MCVCEPKQKIPHVLRTKVLFYDLQVFCFCLTFVNNILGDMAGFYPEFYAARIVVGHDQLLLKL